LEIWNENEKWYALKQTKEKVERNKEINMSAIHKNLALRSVREGGSSLLS